MTTTHRRYRRTVRRYNRRTYTYPALRRMAGWLVLGAFVFVVAGLGSGVVGRYIDDMHTDPTHTDAPTYTYVPSATCPTEDSCTHVFAWTGTDYTWTEVPQVP